MSEHLYTPSQWGSEFHSLPFDEVLGAGSAGPGKSFVLLMDPVQQIMVEHARWTQPNSPQQWFIEKLGSEEDAKKLWPLHTGPDGRGMSVGHALHMRRMLSMLDDTIKRAKRIFPLIDPPTSTQPGCTWNEQRHQFTFSSGYIYQFGHCKDPDDWGNYMSNEYTWIGFDELVQFEEEQYDQITTRRRTSDKVLRYMLKIRAMSNPMMKKSSKEDFTVKDPFWVRKRFVEPDPAGKTVLERRLKRRDGTEVVHTWMYYPATLYDNPDPEFVRQYEEQLLKSKPHIRQALLYGNWFITEGSFYGEWWNEALHTCAPFDPPKEWAWFRSMDWGFKTEGCVHWWALDYDGTLYCVYELTFIGKGVKQVSKEIREVEEKILHVEWVNGRSPITGPADTQLWEERGDGVESKAEQFMKEGVHWMQANKKSRQTNAEHFVKRLEDHEKGTKPAGIVFFRRCKMAIMTIPGIPTNTKNVNEPQDGGPDHWHDSVLYASAFASRGRNGIPNRVEEKDDWEEDDEKRPAGYGRDGYGSQV